MKEAFRFLVDLAVISLVESEVMENKDFIRTENYNLRLKPAGARKIVNEFSNMQNQSCAGTSRCKQRNMFAQLIKILLE